MDKSLIFLTFDHWFKPVPLHEMPKMGGYPMMDEVDPYMQVDDAVITFHNPASPDFVWYLTGVYPLKLDPFSDPIELTYDTIGHLVSWMERDW